MIETQNIKVEKLSRHIGAEIKGVDLSAPLDASTRDAIYQAWLDNTVVVFRRQTLSQADHIRVSEMFGELAPLGRPAKYFPPGFKDLLPGIMLISNIRENGVAIGALPDGEMMFHHDMIHAELPDKATFLYSVEIPSRGGDTIFASGYAAWDSLNENLKSKLLNRKAFHHYNYGSTARGDGKGIEAFGEHHHPAVRTHEETGRKSLYINRLMTVALEGMSEAESKEVLDPVFDHMERDEFLYTHKWCVGDLVVWDNRCSTHARTDFPAEERRLMLRTTVKAESRPVF
jgi:taurine dioxygenase